MAKYFEGVGRRKTSSARVRLFSGKGTNTVNSKPVEEYFKVKQHLVDVLEPFVTTSTEGKYYFTANVIGGGTSGQKDAVQLGLSRALYSMDEELKSPLRKNGMVTRDPRMVERKKYNQRKARKKSQFSKR